MVSAVEDVAFCDYWWSTRMLEAMLKLARSRVKVSTFAKHKGEGLICALKK